LNRTFVYSLIFLALTFVGTDLSFAQSPTFLQKTDKGNLKSAGTKSKTAKNVSLSQSDKQTVNASLHSGSDRLMSINYINVDIREALSALAIQREINIAVAPDVSGQITVHLYEVTLNEALAAICLAGGFTYSKQGDLYYVHKPGDAEDTQDENVEMRIFKLQYIEMDKIQEILGAVPDMRMVKIHEPTQTIIVEDTPKNIKRIETIIRAWDTMPKQVLIEAKILEVRLTDDMALGVDWDKILGDARISTAGFSEAILPTADNPDVAPAPDNGIGLFSNMITGAGTSHQFAAAIDALRLKTTVNALATPRVIAIHGKSAKVQIGGQQGYRLTTVNVGTSTETIEFIDTGIVLEITPFIDDKSNILLSVRPSITSATLEAGGIPVTKTALVSTWLMAKHGETVFIGGLIQDNKTKEKNAVPVLGSIPGIGILFGRNARSLDKSEIVILIKPLILEADRKLVNQEAIEKFKKPEKILNQEPLPPIEQFKELLFPVDDEIADKERNKATSEQYIQGEQH
jgi:type II secretory pathway component GspD/PulD (secretin)